MRHIGPDPASCRYCRGTGWLKWYKRRRDGHWTFAGDALLALRQGQFLRYQRGAPVNEVRGRFTSSQACIRLAFCAYVTNQALRAADASMRSGGKMCYWLDPTKA